MEETSCPADGVCGETPSQSASFMEPSLNRCMGDITDDQIDAEYEKVFMPEDDDLRTAFDVTKQAIIYWMRDTGHTKEAESHILGLEAKDFDDGDYVDVSHLEFEASDALEQDYEDFQEGLEEYKREAIKDHIKRSGGSTDLMHI